AVGVLRARVRLIDDQRAPRAVVLDPVLVQLDVLRAGEHDTAADRRRAGQPVGAVARHVRVVVVVDVVVLPDVADAGAQRAGRAAGTLSVLGRRSVVVVLGVLRGTGLVVVELRVFDQEVPAGVSPGEAQRAVLGVD